MMPSRRSLDFAILLLAGVSPYLFCTAAHVCMAGHRQHPPYAWWHGIVDAGWVAAFALAAVAVAFSDLRRRYLWVGLLVFVGASRLLSWPVFPLDLGVVVGLCVVAFREIRRYRRARRELRQS